MSMVKFGWWAPWKVTQPWLPRGWLGTDEWHNPAVSLVLPFLGAFHLWFRNWRDYTEGHYSLSPEMDAPECPICQHHLADLELPRGWWWNPPRPDHTMPKEAT